MNLRSFGTAGILAGCVAGLAFPCLTTAAGGGRLDLPSFSHLQSKATDVVDIALGAWPLALASKFMDVDDVEGAEVKNLISGIKSIAVRSYEFDSDFAYSKQDIDAVRAQLQGWTQLAQVRKRDKSQQVDVYVRLAADQARGFALVAGEPRKFTTVNIVGAIDMRKLHELEGQFGIPGLELEQKK